MTTEFSDCVVFSYLWKYNALRVPQPSGSNLNTLYVKCPCGHRFQFRSFTCADDVNLLVENRRDNRKMTQ